MQSYKVPAWEFYGWEPEELAFPDGWKVQERKMRGHSAPKLPPEIIAEKLQHPVGAPTLRELAKGKRLSLIHI